MAELELLKSCFQVARFARSEPVDRPKVLLFGANGHPQSTQMLTVLSALGKRFGEDDIELGFCDVGRLVASVQPLKIEGIPTIWIVRNGEIGDVLAGAAPGRLRDLLNSLQDGSFKPVENDALVLKELLDNAQAAATERGDNFLAEQMVLLAGPGEKIPEVLDHLKRIYGSQIQHVVMSREDGVQEFDEELAEALTNKLGDSLKRECKLLIRGKAKDLDKLDEAEVKAALIEMEQRLNGRLKALINQAPIMLFIKGSKAAPFCKFSREMVRLLKEADIDFECFNIFDDSTVREGLKKFSDWPTFPQLYVKGELIGGLDILKQMITENPKGLQGLKESLLASC
eukprot:Protomagalhaensia_sp_Gyna_25__6005@NODE_93_length_5325_cov_100_196557_g72_i0_p3_GENE_NODE_93_length_5325_cov_100_196557_g72_i0NODE_93_length_5325_cov_100_196557_g72_i0_p3_ORF_typecomplete_len342_score68_84Glutaredoxin/PF00462_24/4_3e02Glutaredoxin/PF00462_24/7_2e17Thioredoxin/PF00085_20/0_0007Thioredoxin/PF00085_20/2_8e03SH3BGR/PF04908_15/0_018_NODE_93_length_5325_cov_100_196557_g72_i025323557